MGMMSEEDIEGWARMKSTSLNRNHEVLFKSIARNLIRQVKNEASQSSLWRYAQQEANKRSLDGCYVRNPTLDLWLRRGENEEKGLYNLFYRAVAHFKPGMAANFLAQELNNCRQQLALVRDNQEDGPQLEFTTERYLKLVERPSFPRFLSHYNAGEQKAIVAEIESLARGEKYRKRIRKVLAGISAASCK